MNVGHLTASHMTAERLTAEGNTLYVVHNCCTIRRRWIYSNLEPHLLILQRAISCALRNEDEANGAALICDDVSSHICLVKYPAYKKTQSSVPAVIRLRSLTGYHSCVCMRSSVWILSCIFLLFLGRLDNCLPTRITRGLKA